MSKRKSRDQHRRRMRRVLNGLVRLGVAIPRFLSGGRSMGSRWGDGVGQRDHAPRPMRTEDD